MNNKIDQQKKCDAKSKRTGNRCQGLAMANGKCRVHGGKSLRGTEHGNFKTGKYSRIAKMLKLSQDYEEALKDEKLHVCRDEIALIDALMLERLKKLDTGETEDSWKLLQSTYKKVIDAHTYLASGAAKKLSEGKLPKYTEEDFEQGLIRLGEIIKHGLARYSAYEVVQPMIEQRRRLCETERKRLKELQQMMPAEQVFMTVYLIVDIAKRFIPQPEYQMEFAKQLAEAVNGAKKY